MDGFPFSIPELTGLGGIVALVAAFAWSLSTGRLWTRSQVDAVVKLHEQATASERTRGDEWKAAHAQTTEQVTTLAEASGITADFIRKADALMEGGPHAQA